jgi:hypothetical protein
MVATEKFAAGSVADYIIGDTDPVVRLQAAISPATAA